MKEVAVPCLTDLESEALEQYGFKVEHGEKHDKVIFPDGTREIWPSPHIAHQYFLPDGTEVLVSELIRHTTPRLHVIRFPQKESKDDSSTPYATHQ